MARNWGPGQACKTREEYNAKMKVYMQRYRAREVGGQGRASRWTETRLTERWADRQARV